MVADLNQAELRVCAHVSQDANLLTAYKNGLDVHAQTAKALNVERFLAKVVNFACLYRISGASLAAHIKAETGQDVSAKKGQDFIDKWYATYSGIPKWQNEVVTFAHKNGYVESLFGRRRHLEDTINSVDASIRGRAERQAINFLIQSVVGDIMKRAMAAFWRSVDTSRAHILVQAHDELVVECAERYTEEAAKILKDSLEGASQLSVPIPTDVGVGYSWGTAKK